jgi:tRNA (guanine-N7-)-methyltransferase
VEENKAKRRIRSYVLRQGRLTSGQAYALAHFWQYYGIDYSATILDLNKIFNRVAPKVLDIGVGMGNTSIALAKAHPENDYLAVEVHQPGVGSLLRQIEAAAISNVRVICHDVMEVLTQQIPDRCLEHVYIFFPDPWPKKRHHKRRLINSEFVSLLIPKLMPHARLYIATDWQELALHVLTICDNHGGLINLAGIGNAAPRPTWRPLTKFEQRGKNLQHSNWDFVYALS